MVRLDSLNLIQNIVKWKMDEKFRQNVGGTNVSILKNEVSPTSKMWIVIT